MRKSKSEIVHHICSGLNATFSSSNIYCHQQQPILLFDLVMSIYNVIFFQSIDSSMSTYDLIGSMHTGRAARSMHNGPGFFPRHMLMMLM